MTPAPTDTHTGTPGSTAAPRPRHGALFDATPASAGMKKTAVRGVAVTFGSQLAQFALGFVSTAILARLLTPETFGLVAMTSVFTGFVWLFSDAGLAMATIQREKITHEQVSCLLWINVLLGGAIALLLVGVAPWIAAFYNEPRLVGITRWIALSFVIGGFTVQHKALLRRQMRFTTIAILDLVALSTGIVVGITMGYLGYGYWSLVGMSNASAIASLVAVWALVPWRPGLPRRGAGVMPLLRFGRDIFSSNIFHYVARQADTLLIGWKAGPIALGFYDKAYRMLLFPVRQINHPVGAVLVPALSRLNAEPPRFARFFLRGVELLTGVTVPLVLAACVFADEVVALWLGDQWAECAHLFRLLGVAAVIGVLSNPMNWLLVASGQGRRYRRITLTTATLYVAAFVAGLPYGAAGVATAYSAAAAVLFLPVWYFSLRGSPVRLSALLRAFAPAVISAALATLAGRAVIIVAPTLVPSWSHGAVALLAFVSYASVYAAALLGIFRRWSVYRGVLGDLRSSRQAKPAAAAAPAA